MTAPTTTDKIRNAVGAMGPGPLSEGGLVEHVHPLFSRVLARDEIYLANHSLGRPLDCVVEDLAEYAELWIDRMDDAWGEWIGECDAYRARVAGLIGAGRADSIVPKTSAGQGLRAVLNALPSGGSAGGPKIVATRGEFDSIDFILKTYAARGRARVTWVEPDGEGLFGADRIVDAIDESTDLVVCSKVFFASGQVLEGVERVIEAARSHGALSLLDVYHAAGVMPIGFDDSGADFAIGGNYKYTRGGAGACWLAVRAGLLRGENDPMPGADGLGTLDTGWFAKRDTFSYQRSDEIETEPGGDGWLESTPPVATYYQARSGLELTLAIGVDRLRAYSAGQQEFLIERLGEHGVGCRVIEPRGAYALIPVASGAEAMRALKDEGVNVDARPMPGTGIDCVRVCPDLLTTQGEMERAAVILGRVLC